MLTLAQFLPGYYRMTKAKHRPQKRLPVHKARPPSADLSIILKALRLAEAAALSAPVFPPIESSSLISPQIPQRLTSASHQSNHWFTLPFAGGGWGRN